MILFKIINKSKEKRGCCKFKKEFDKGLKQMKSFYLTYGKDQAVSDQFK